MAFDFTMINSDIVSAQHGAMRCCVSIIAVLLLVLPIAEVQAGRVAGAWQDAGPGPITTAGNVENVARGPDATNFTNEAVGAVGRIAPHPTDPNIMYIATVNGGIWKTSNAQGTPPTWTPLTDHVVKSLSFASIALDHHRPDTILAGYGWMSSFDRTGGDQLGILRSDDAGASWRLISDPLVANTIVNQLFVHGDTILACTIGGASPGIIRSADGGATWTRPDAGLRFISCYDMAFRIPSTAQDPLTLGFAFMDGSLAPGLAPGLYRTTDGGLNWVEYVTDVPQLPVLPVGTGPFLLENAKVRIHPGTGRVVVGYVLMSDKFNANLAFSDGDGAAGTWVPLPRPQTVARDGTTGTNPFVLGLGPEEEEDEEFEEEVSGGQAGQHFSLGLHPDNHDYVFVGGDRQETDPAYNVVGARMYSGRLFVCVINGSSPSDSSCLPFTHGSDTTPGTTANFSAPHPDSRDLQADAAGNIIEADDGGIYRRTNPLVTDRAAGGLGDWYSMIGNLKNTEVHDVAYDSVNDIFMTGNQDVGTTRQISPWDSNTIDLLGGDGGDVFSVRAASNVSVNLASYPCFGTAVVAFINTSNTFFDFFQATMLGLPGTPGDCSYFSFKTAVAANRLVLPRLLVQGSRTLYESHDYGRNAVALAPDYYCQGYHFIDGLVYGGRKDGLDFPDLIYAVCRGRMLVVRSPLLGNPAALHRYSLVLPTPGATEYVSLAEDPDDMDVVFAALTSNAVVMYRGLATTVLPDDANLATLTTDGFTFSDLSGNIASKSTQLQTILFMRGASGEAYLITGGRSGAFITGPMSNSGAFGVVWKDLEPLPSSLLPNAYVFELAYDAAYDVLLAGTLGRGVQRMDGASRAVDTPLLACPADIVIMNGTEGGFVVDYEVALQQGVGDLGCTPANGSLFSPGFTDVECIARNALYGDAACSFTVFVGCYDTQAGHVFEIDQGCDWTAPYCIPTDASAPVGSGAPGVCSNDSGCNVVLLPGQDAACTAPFLLTADVTAYFPGDLCAYEIDLGDLATQLVAPSAPLNGVPLCSVSIDEGPHVTNRHMARHLLQVREPVFLRLSVFVSSQALADALKAVLLSAATEAFLVEYFRARDAGLVLLNVPQAYVTVLATVTSDPHFVTPLGRKFDFQGVPGASYCVVTDASVQVNARFMGAAGASTAGGAASAPADERQATWMDQVAVLHAGDRVLVEAASPLGAPFARSFGTVSVNGEPLRALKAVKKLPTGLSIARKNTRVYITIPGTAVVEVEVVRAAFWEAGKGPGKNFLNLKLSQFNRTEGGHGILGQSFDGAAEAAVVLEENDYKTSDVFATDCVYNRFKGN